MIDVTTLPIIVYFIVLGIAGIVVLLSWSPIHMTNELIIVMPFAIGAISICWKLIFQFMAEVAVEKNCGNTTASLLNCHTPEWEDFDVFVQAYVDVTKCPSGWAMSSQLLMFVVSGCTFLLSEMPIANMSRSVGISYIILGFLGAISVSFPLAFADLYNLNSHRSTPSDFSIPMAICSVIAIISVLILPITWEDYRKTYYTYALMILHVILAGPFLLKLQSKTMSLNNSKLLAVQYLLIAGVSFCFHMINIFNAIRDVDGNWMEMARGAWGTTCQKSISFDVCFTSFACMFYMRLTRPHFGSLMAFLTPFLSVSVTFPLFQACRIMFPE